MNRNKLKTYAPQARRDFIAAVTDRAAFYGLTAEKIDPVVEEGDVAVIGDTALPVEVAAKRKQLEERINRDGFEQVMEAMAYTWFNRLVAIRFMELHGYLEHGLRVLSHPEGKSSPEILEHAEHLDLPDLDIQQVIDLKLDGTKESELFRILLIAQCNALSTAMPFLFERIEDETELLLPDNLLHSDSLIRKLVGEISEEDWQEVEIIGWLYQFYISEKQDEVIGKAVKSEDIPAATQLFTPNWIVLYMLHNTLGRKWLAAYPQSPLRERLDFYVEPSADQLPTLNSLNPEELTLLDPACGSGHILVEAYDLLKTIYQERGYGAQDIPRLILEKNLYGLEIDERAAQLAAFALLMKAREDDRRIFEREIRPHIHAIHESAGLDALSVSADLNTTVSESARAIGVESVSQKTIEALISLFENAKTLGSLVSLNADLENKLPAITSLVDHAGSSGDLLGRAAARTLGPFVALANVLGAKYSAVVTNPPYLHTKRMPPFLKHYVEEHFADTSTDLFEVFLVRSLRFTDADSLIGFVTPYIWMFLISFESLRQILLHRCTVTSLVQLEYNAFEPDCVPVCIFTLLARKIIDTRGEFIRLSDFPGFDQQPVKTLQAIAEPRCSWRYSAASEDFSRIPGSVFAYWLSKTELQIFETFDSLSDYAEPRQGLITGDNEQFMRLWWEVSLANSAILPLTETSDERKNKRWFPYEKGGPYRKWYGNHHFLVDWAEGGRAIRNFVDKRGKLRSRPQNISYYFQTGATWSSLTSGNFALRYTPAGFIFDAKGPLCFPKESGSTQHLVAFGNTKLVNRFLTALAPTLDYSQGPVGKLPFSLRDVAKVDALASEAIAIAREDWDSQETSWDFEVHPLLRPKIRQKTLASSWEVWCSFANRQRKRMRELEEENNRHFTELFQIEGTGLIDVTDKEVTLREPNAAELTRHLISFAIGCMMGRYSLDKAGLVYAFSGNKMFDLGQYKTFPADLDGIIPVTESDWFKDAAANRFENFVKSLWGTEHLEENLNFVAEGLGAKQGEQSRDTVRRYLCLSFFKDHLQLYKGPKHPPRPIYWLFSSGKERAFQCLVYLHRYNEGTLARMRTEYVIPPQGRTACRVEQLKGDIVAATSTAHRKKLEKEQNTLVKQREELQEFDEKLRHYADQKISIDLDDGVKVNYGKFGDLLAEVKTVTGEKK